MFIRPVKYFSPDEPTGGDVVATETPDAPKMDVGSWDAPADPNVKRSQFDATPEAKPASTETPIEPVAVEPSKEDPAATEEKPLVENEAQPVSAQEPPADAPLSPEAVALQETQARLATFELAQELRIPVDQLPEWQNAAKGAGFGDNLRAYYAWTVNIADTNAEIAAYAADVAEQAQFPPDAKPIPGSGGMYKDAEGNIYELPPYLQKSLKAYEDTCRQSLENSRLLQASQANEKLSQEREFKQQVAGALEYAERTLEVPLSPYLKEAFSKTDPRMTPKIVDEFNQIFQSRLKSEQTKWARDYKSREETPSPTPANIGTSPVVQTQPTLQESPSLQSYFAGVA